MALPNSLIYGGPDLLRKSKLSVGELYFELDKLFRHTSQRSSRMVKLAGELEERTWDLRQTGFTLFEIKADLKEGSELLKDEYYWVTKSGQVTSLFRGNFDVTDDGRVAITCRKRPKKSVWHHVHIPGVNVSYIPTGNARDYLREEMENLGLSDVPPTYSHRETWTTMSDVKFYNTQDFV